MAHDKYLGDGVYASFDGYQIWLAANNPSNKVIALEPEVVESFEEYIKENKLFVAMHSKDSQF